MQFRPCPQYIKLLSRGAAESPGSIRGTVKREGEILSDTVGGRIGWPQILIVADVDVNGWPIIL